MEAGAAKLRVPSVVHYRHSFSSSRSLDLTVLEGLAAHGTPKQSTLQPCPVRQDTSKCFWGVDLHWCDLESFTGFPAELGSSPWDSDAEAS